MYGTPAGLQVHAGHWEHDSLREANAHRRHRVDSDFEHDVNKARELHHRLVAVAAIILALTGLVLI
jgi:hypothetical protein